MDVFDLFASIKLNSDEYDKGLDEAEAKSSGIGDKIGNALSVAGKVGAAAITAASGAVVKLASDSVGAYAQFEQLEGGVKTLFGAKEMTLQEYADSLGVSAEEAKEKYDGLIAAENEAFKNAGEAYKTAGLNMNDYMETITSFAAALKSSTGSELEAAQVADTAIQDMSDNANKMGTSMESIQNAYMGFSKQNYTMLDNLKLGYGGTKTEMERLLKDAEALTGVKYDINNLSDVYKAIHEIQKNLGITGTTASEAMKTIEGSANMTRAAWDNVIIAIGRGEGISEAFDNLLTAVLGDGSEGTGLLNNIIPRIQTVMEGIGNFITQASPLLAEAIPKLIDAIFPSLLQSAISLVGMLASNLPGIISSLGSAVITAVQSILSEVSQTFLGWDMFENINTFMGGILVILSDRIPDFFAKGVDWIINLLQGFTDGGDILGNISYLYDTLLFGISEGLPQILEKGVELISFLVNGMLENYPTLITTMGEILNMLISFIMENLPMFLEKGIELIGNIVDGVIQNLPAIFEAFVSVVSGAINTISEHLPEFLAKGQELLGQIIGGIGEKLPELLSTMAELLAQTLAKIGEHLPEFLAKGIELVGKLIAGLIESIPDVLAWVGDLFSQVLGAFADYDWLSIGSNIIQGIIDGLLGGLSDIWDAATSVASSAFDAACDFLGIKSPSKLGRYIGRMFDAGIAEDLEDNAPVDEAISAVESVYDAAQGAVKDIDIPMGASYTSSITSRNKGTETDAAVLQLLAKYLPLLANMQIVLQDRTIAGKLAPYINEELGALADWEAVL